MYSMDSMIVRKYFSDDFVLLRYPILFILSNKP